MSRASMLQDEDAKARRELMKAPGRKRELKPHPLQDQAVTINPIAGVPFPQPNDGSNNHTFLIEDWIVRSGLPEDVAFNCSFRSMRIAAALGSNDCFHDLLIGQGDVRCQCGLIHPIIVHSSEIGEPIEDQPSRMVHLEPHPNAGQMRASKIGEHSCTVRVIDWASRLWSDVPFPERHAMRCENLQNGRAVDDLSYAVLCEVVSCSCGQPHHRSVFHESELQQ